MQSFQISLPCRFEIETGNVHECFPMICKAKNRRWFLDYSLVPFDFYHLIFIWRNSVAFIFLNNHWLWFLLRNRISIIVKFELFFFTFFLASSLFFAILSLLFLIIFLRWKIFLTNWIPLSVLNIALFLLIHVWKTKDSIRVIHCRPDIDITIDTTCGEILVT